MLVYGRLAQRGAFAVGPLGINLTPEGATLVAELGVVGGDLAGSRRPFCRTCMDWSERRHHLAGVLGATLLDRFEQLGWARRIPKSRVLAFSPAGEAAMRDWLG